jgi:hypothetical protein
VAKKGSRIALILDGVGRQDVVLTRYPVVKLNDQTVLSVAILSPL